VSDVISRLVQLEAAVSYLESKDAFEASQGMFSSVSKDPFIRNPFKIREMSEKPLVRRALHGAHRGVVINTKDPMHKGRVKVYVPMIHANVPERNIPYAEVLSFFGSMDDQGSVFTPPAGSTVLVQFESGNRELPMVVGAIHNMTRGISAQAETGLIIEEERHLWGGAPGRRTDAKNTTVNSDMKSLMPPWRGESYDGPDRKPGPAGDSEVPPFIYGIKTPEKHFLQFVDGDSRDRKKGKRVVLQSSRGATLFIKDDSFTKPEEIFDNQYWDDKHDAYPGLKYSVRPFNGHKIELKHAGMQLQSVGGARIIFSDETEFPIEENEWNSGWSPRGRFRSFTALQSITEHTILLRDHEHTRNMRSDTDGIFAITATGNYIGLRDHTIGQRGGPKRGIIIWSTSNHTIELNDYTVKNTSPRKGSGTVDHHTGYHTPNAKRAYIRIRSGWGQVFEMNDLGSQENNANQFILLRNHNKITDDCNGPPWNYIRMECVRSRKLFTIYGAGNFVINVCRNALRLVQKGDDVVYVELKGHLTHCPEGSIRHICKTGIMEHTERGVIMMLVGRVLKRKLEFPTHRVIIGKDEWPCPFTGHMHRDTASRHVYASE
jgi:hypothetical protein